MVDTDTTTSWLHRTGQGWKLRVMAWASLCVMLLGFVLCGLFVQAAVPRWWLMLCALVIVLAGADVHLWLRYSARCPTCRHAVAPTVIRQQNLRVPFAGHLLAALMALSCCPLCGETVDDVTVQPRAVR